jgi:hypothetical protein
LQKMRIFQVPRLAVLVRQSPTYMSLIAGIY